MKHCTLTAILVHLITIFLYLDTVVPSVVIQFGSGSGNLQPREEHWYYQFAWAGQSQRSMNKENFEECSSSCLKFFYCQAYTFNISDRMCYQFDRLNLSKQNLPDSMLNNFYSGTHEKPYAAYKYCDGSWNYWNIISTWIIPYSLPGFAIHYDINDLSKDVYLKHPHYVYGRHNRFDIKSYEHQPCLVRIELYEVTNKVLAENDGESLSVEDGMDRNSLSDWNPKHYFRMDVIGGYKRFLSINTPSNHKKTLQIIVPGEYPINCNFTNVKPFSSKYRLQFKAPSTLCKDVNPEMKKDLFSTPDP